MTTVALAAITAAVVAALAFSQIIRSLIRQHARERDLLLNQLLNLAGKPWQPAPATTTEPVTPKNRETVVSPEQMPDHEVWS